MSILKRLRCAMFGHDWLYLAAPPGVMSGRFGGSRRCMCCREEWEGLKYPPMPPIKCHIPMPQPARRDAAPVSRESIERELGSLRARVARLEKRCRGVE